MRAWARFLLDCCRQALWGDFAELDTQIHKLRALRDSYEELSQRTR